MNIILSDQQLELLQKIYEQGVYIVDDSHRSVLEFLKSHGLIIFFPIICSDEDKTKSGALYLESCGLIAQITEQGKAYVNSKIDSKKQIKIDLLLKYISIFISIVALIISLLK